MTHPSHWTAALVAMTLAFGIHGVAYAADGVKPALVYDGAAFADLAGGVRRGTTYLGTLRLQLTLDGSRLAGVPGMTLFVEGLNIHGGHPSSFAGDAQGVSSLEGPARWMLYEGWIQQNLFQNRLSILIGRYDLNTELYRLQSAALFGNSSFGIGPEFSRSGRGGPSIFPDTSVGARIAWKPATGMVLRTAVLDAHGDGLLLVAEGAYLVRPTSKEPPHSPRFRLGRVAGLPPYTAKAALGAWHYIAQQPGSSGVYALADVTVYIDPASPSRRLNVFGQFGVGDARVNRFARYTGAGIVMAGPFKARQNDELGLAIAVAHNRTRDEGTLECTYLAPLTSHLAIQPDLQYVLHPNADRPIGNAFVALLRFELSF